MLFSSVVYRGNKECNTKNLGSWEMRGFQFYQPVDIGEDWAVINIGKLLGRPNRSSIFPQKVDSLIKCLINEAKNKRC